MKRPLILGVPAPVTSSHQERRRGSFGTSISQRPLKAASAANDAPVVIRSSNTQFRIDDSWGLIYHSRAAGQQAFMGRRKRLPHQNKHASSL